MSTAYAPLRQVTREEIAAFVMPQPLVGQPVLYHRRGLRNDRQAVIRFVRQVHQRSIDLDGGMNNVLHADDPRLHQNEHQRENGSWEYTPYDLLLQERLAALEGNPKKADKASPDKASAEKKG